MKRIHRVPEDGDVRQRGDHLPKQSQPLPFQVGRDRGQPGHVTARTREARDEAGANRIANRHHHARNDRGRVLDGESGGRAGGDDHIDALADKLGDESGNTAIVPFRPSVFDVHIRAFQVAESRNPCRKGPVRFLSWAAVALPRKPMRGSWPPVAHPLRAAMLPPPRGRQ